MQVFKKHGCATALALAAAVFVLAGGAPAAAQQSGPTVQDRKAVMQAQIELLKTQADLNKALQESAGSESAPLPQVIAVFGLDGDMVARLQMSNGLVSNFRAGETIRSGLTVSSITPRQVSVVVGRGKAVKAIPLEFFAVVPAGSTGMAGLPPGVPGMPGAMPGGFRPQPIPRELLPAPPDVRVPSIGGPVAPVASIPAGATPAAPSLPPVATAAPAPAPLPLPVAAK